MWISNFENSHVRSASVEIWILRKMWGQRRNSVKPASCKLPILCSQIMWGFAPHANHLLYSYLSCTLVLHANSLKSPYLVCKASVEEICAFTGSISSSSEETSWSPLLSAIVNTQSMFTFHSMVTTAPYLPPHFPGPTLVNIILMKCVEQWH